MALVSLIVFLQIFLSYHHHFVDGHSNHKKCFPECDTITTEPPSTISSRTNLGTSSTPSTEPPFTSALSEKKLLKYLQPYNIGRHRWFDDLNHNDTTLCTRNCTRNSDPRICYYIFTIENYHAMGIACKNCENNPEDCRGKHCIPADGIERQVQSINRQIPGPAIDVCRGDRIIVDVVNKMEAEEVTIHWHGLHQKGTPWMDGVPFVTQCPIQSNSKFRYDFKALTNGTFFYRSHIGTSHANGVYGSLTVRIPDKDDPNRLYHHYDLPSHNILIADWNHSPVNTYFPGYYKDQSHIPIRPETYLINGLGRYTTETPRAEFHVEQGLKYRFRIIAGTSSTCPFKFSIQNHSLKVVALDGFPCNPIDLEVLVMVGGQRTDVVIDANKEKKSTHWIIVQGMDACANITQAAHLLYDKVKAPTEPYDPPTFEKLHDGEIKYLNNHESSCSEVDNVCTDTLTEPQRYRAPDALKRLMDEKPNITIELHAMNVRRSLEQVTTEEYEPFYRPMEEAAGAFASVLNNVSGIFPPVPLLTQRRDIPSDFPICSPGCDKKSTQFRRCLCLISIELNSVVDIVFDDGTIGTGPKYPVHVHGHHFTVIPVNRTNDDDSKRIAAPEVGDVIQRDTVLVPLDGKTTIRFRADNPGYWLMHCHYHMHMEGGMFLVFQVGSEAQIPPPPKDFPKCGNFLPPIEDL